MKLHEKANWFIVYNVFTPTRNTRGLSVQRNDMEHTTTWMNSRIHTWK